MIEFRCVIWGLFDILLLEWMFSLKVERKESSWSKEVCEHLEESGVELLQETKKLKQGK